MSDYFSSGFTFEEAWHKKSDVTGRLLAVAEAKQRAGHNYIVEKVPLMTADNQQMPGVFATRRCDNRMVLSPKGVGSNYHIVQNAALYDLMLAFIDEGDAVFRNGGTLKGGSVVWLQAELPKLNYVVADQWKVNQLLTIVNSHDTSLNYMAFFSSVNVVCANTLSQALRRKGNCVKIRHTRSAEARTREAHKALGLAPKAQVEAQELFNAMAKAKMTTSLADEFIKAMFPLPVVTDEKGEEKAGELRASLMLKREWVASRLQDSRYVDSSREVTAWSAHNALTDALQYGPMGLRKTTDRTNWVLFDEGDRIRTESVAWLKQACLAS